jgi:hypothetical protein
LTTPHSNPGPQTITVCCGLTLREPIERWLGPLRDGWPGTPPRLRLLTIPMLAQESTAIAEEQAAGSALLAIIPEHEPFSQTQTIVEHARRVARPALLLCERVDERHRAIIDEGILVEPWDTDPADVLAILATLDRRQPTVTRLSRELDVVERLLTSVQVPGAVGEELQLAGLLPDVLIPEAPPKIRGLEVGLAHRAASAISRDLVDIALIDENTVRVFAADGLSRGTAGALLAMRLLRAVRSLGENDDLHKIFHPGVALAELNQEVCEIGSHGRPHRASALYAVLEIRTGELTVASAGFPPPMIVARGSLRRVGRASTALGQRDGVEFAETTDRLSPDDLLVIASDGVEEAFRDSPGFDLAAEARRIRSSEQPLLDESHRMEQVFDSLPGSLHRANDCTLMSVRIHESPRRGAEAA